MWEVLEDIHVCCAPTALSPGAVCQKPGWVKVWITVAFMWACALGLIIYLTIVRMRTRARLGIRAPVGLECLADFCTVWWCTTCALCQVRITASLRSALKRA